MSKHFATAGILDLELSINFFEMIQVEAAAAAAHELMPNSRIDFHLINNFKHGYKRKQHVSQGCKERTNEKITVCWLPMDLFLY